MNRKYGALRRSDRKLDLALLLKAQRFRLTGGVSISKLGQRAIRLYLEDLARGHKQRSSKLYLNLRGTAAR
jgi:hypothetical protein